jgi:hypothetical protein
MAMKTAGLAEDNGRDSEVELAVLAYLRRHPFAADTLEGITHWWLPQQRYLTAELRIEAVLVHLVDQGVLQLRRLPDGTAMYALDATRREGPLPN